MPAQWTGELVGKMHNHKISATELAKEAGLTKPYLSMILNGHRNPPGIQYRLEDALGRLIMKKEAKK